MKKEKEKYVRQWLAKAQENIKVVGVLYKSEFPPYNAIGFHLQQAAEKYLKGFLEYHSILFAKTHDIAYLLKLCATKNALLSEIDEGNLSEYAVDMRYPGDFYTLTNNDIDEAIKVVEQIKKW